MTDRSVPVSAGDTQGERERPAAFGRRRLLGFGAAVAAGAAIASSRMLAATSGPINDPATATQQAVRLTPPKPTGGFDPGALYVALYGHPGSPILGCLGEQGIDAAVHRARAVAAAYAPFGRPVVPTFEIIATVASASAGGDGDYSTEFPPSKFTPWIDAAAANGMHVLLDLQSGRATFTSQAREIAGLLASPHVSLALDPEWRVGPSERPGGGRIGTVDGAEVNETDAFLDELIVQSNLPPKMLVVHQFTPSMVTNKGSISGTRNVQVVFQMDGFGSLGVKHGSWNRMVADLPAGSMTGWKNFYDEDSPTPTAAQSLAVIPTPVYISYQ